MYVQLNKKLDIIGFGKYLKRSIPEVLDVTTVTDRLGNTTKNLKIKLFCPINKVEYANSPCSYIEVRLSDKPIEEFRNNTQSDMIEMIKKKLFERIKDPDEIAQIEELLKGNGDIPEYISQFFPLIKAEMATNVFEETKLLGKFKAKKRDLEVKKARVIEKNRDVIRSRNANIEQKIYTSETNVKKEFKKMHNAMTIQGIDPVLVFENNYQKTSEGMKKIGAFIESPLKLNGFDSYLKDIFKQITSEIEDISSSQSGFVVKGIPHAFGNLETVVDISENNLKRFGSLCHLIFIAYDDSGLALQTFSHPLVIDQILDQLTLNTDKYTINSARNNISGTSKVIVSNDTNKNCNITLYAKTFSNYTIKNLNQFEIVHENLNISPRSKVSLYDGTTDIKRNPIRFPVGKNVLYRSTINFNNKSFDNVKTSFSKALKRKNESIPFCTLTPKVNEKGFMMIEASNLSDNIESCRLLKFRFKTRARGNKEYISNNFGIQDANFYDVTSENIVFEDYDMFDGKYYEYILECKLKNGEVKQAISNKCIERFETKQHIANINVRKVTTTPGSSDGERDNRAQSLSRKVTVIFDVDRKPPQFERILTQVLGRGIESELFTEELNRLRNLEGFTYSIKVEKFNKQTGESSEVTDIQVSSEDSQGLSFSDFINEYHDVYYKLTPRIKPTEELIRTVENIINDLASSERMSQINYSSLAMDNVRKSLTEGVVSFVKNKYNLNAALKKGLIVPESVRNASQNVDMFYDASTGDIAYVDINRQNFTDYKSLSLTYINHYELKFLNPEENKQKNKFKNAKRYLKNRKFILTFQANQSDYEIDYYVVFIKEGRSVYLDGAIHSKDTGDQINFYNYLVDHIGSEGDVEYYLVPVTKNGEILRPNLIYKTIL